MYDYGFLNKLITTVIFLGIFGYIPYYLAFNLYDVMGWGISTIYDNSINYFIIVSNPNINGVE
jgi:hypothetical protein